MLTMEQIKDIHATSGHDKAIQTLCDMALSALELKAERDRLREGLEKLVLDYRYEKDFARKHDDYEYSNFNAGALEALQKAKRLIEAIKGGEA